MVSYLHELPCSVVVALPHALWLRYPVLSLVSGSLSIGKCIYFKMCLDMSLVEHIVKQSREQLAMSLSCMMKSHTDPFTQELFLCQPGGALYSLSLLCACECTVIVQMQASQRAWCSVSWSAANVLTHILTNHVDKSAGCMLTAQPTLRQLATWVKCSILCRICTPMRAMSASLGQGLHMLSQQDKLSRECVYHIAACTREAANCCQSKRLRSYEY